MRSSIVSAAVVLAGMNLVNGQTFTDCNPTKKTCPADPGLGTTVTYDFTKANDADWKVADGTTLSYGSDGAVFSIGKKTDAPTIGMNKYIMFGKVSVTMKASPGKGTVSSFILESDDLDEIDWEWLGADDGNVQSNFFGKGDTTTYDRGGTHPVTKPIETYVTYSIDWTKDAVKWYIGDNLVRTLTYSDPKAQAGARYPQTPMRVKMGSWIGCADAAAETDEKTKWTCQWAGGAIDLTQGPYKMLVKSVTVQDYGCGGDYTYTDLSGSYQSIKSSGTCDGKGSSGSSSPNSAASSSVKPSSSAASSTTKSGAVLIESQTANSTKSSSATGTAVSASTSASASATGSASSTLATTTAAPTTSSKASGTAASATSSSAAQVTANAANTMKPKHQYGMIDMGVMALGLGLGYLVM